MIQTYWKLPVYAGAIGFACAALSPSVLAEETRHADAHVHGAAQLSIAEDGDKIEMAFVSPAINLVGFEHVARSEDETEKVHAAIALLKDGQQLFRFKGRECELVTVSVEAEGLLPEKHEHHDDDHHEGDHHNDEHGHHDEHDGDDHEAHGDDEGAHSEFESQYVFNCAAGGTLTSIRVGFFDKWTDLEDVDAVFVGEGKQLSAELTAWMPVLEIAD